MQRQATILHISICIFFWLIALAGSAQTKRFRALTTADGLPQNSVEAFAQDQAGFLWIGTQDGLARYDGYEMKVYRSNPADSSSLSDNFVTALHVDDENNLWVGTRNGINLFRSRTNTFQRYLPNPDKLHQSVNAIHSTQHGIRFFSVGLMVHLSVSDSNQRLVHLHTDSIGKSGVSSVHVMRNGDSILVKPKAISLFRQGQETLIQIPWEGQSVKAMSGQLVEDQTHYFLLQYGLFRIDKDDLSIESIDLNLDENDIRYLNDLQLIDDELWISTDRGLFVINARSLETNSYQHNPKDAFSISYDYVHQVYQDKAGVVWVGTANKGLNYHDPSWEQLQYIHPATDEGIKHPLVWNIATDEEGHLWIATAAGISAFKKVGGQYQSQVLPQKLNALTSIRDVVFQNNLVWIATTSEGLLRYDFSNDHLENLSSKYSLSTECVDLELDANNELWAGFYDGLFKFSANDTLQRIDTLSPLHSSYTLDVSILDDSVFVCHSQGLTVLSIHNIDSAIHLTADVTDTTRLPFSIASATVKTKNALWVGMYDRGIAKLNHRFEVEKLFAEPQGLSGHVIESMLQDNNGLLWIATNQGLSVLNPETEEVFSIGKDDGLRSGEFALGAAYKAVDGDLFFGSVEGLVHFNPDKVWPLLSKEKYLPKVVLSELNINYEDYHQSTAVFRDRELNQVEQIDLYPEQRVVSLSFSALHLTSQHNLTYEFILDGFDTKAARVSSDQRVATYSNLPTGAYTFRVNAFSRNGELAAKPLELRVVVHPPFYEKWWFVALVVLLVIMSVAGAVRYYSFVKYRQKLREVKTREKIQSERARISRDLHDSVGSQLTYMIGSLDNLAFLKQRKGEDSQELNGLSDFARGTMQQLREAIWVINKDRITVEEFKLKLEDHVAKVLSTAQAPEVKVMLSGETSKHMEATKTLHLFRICQEALNNVVKHAKAKQVLLSIHSSEHQLQITISDDGVGFEVENRKSGHYGLININERVQEMDGTINWKSMAGTGTTIHITVSN